MNYNDFMKRVLLAFPLAEVGEDNDGQLVIYTGLKEIGGLGEGTDDASNETVVPIEDDGREWDYPIRKGATNGQGTAGTLVIHYYRYVASGEPIGQQTSVVIAPGDPGNYLSYVELLKDEAPKKLSGIEFCLFIYPLSEFDFVTIKGEQ